MQAATAAADRSGSARRLKGITTASTFSTRRRSSGAGRRKLARERERDRGEPQGLELVLAAGAEGEVPLERARLLGVERVEGEAGGLVVEH